MNGFVNRIVADRWSGLACSEDEIVSPTIDDVQTSVDGMDAKTRTLISLYGLDGSYLAVGGGAGKYVVYISTVEEEFWNLLKQHSEKNGIVMLNAGGQDGDYPSRQVVDKESALRAAKTFFRTGNRDASLSWEKQG